MGSRLARAMRVTAVVAAGLVALASAAAASSGPGTASQVATDVASSLSIQTLPTNLSPPLSAAGNDTAYVDTPTLAKCNTTGTTLKPSNCVFGDPKGTKTMVLWGDSHAFMWFPAVNAVAKADHWRLIALLEYACPVADISVWNPVTRTPYTVCDVFRKNMIAAINKLNPSLVIMTEAFTSQAASGGGAFNTITVAQWQAALEKTLRSLHSSKMKKLVLGSTISTGDIAQTHPAVCLADNVSHVQKCTISDSPSLQSQRSAEIAAAAATKTAYIDVLPWLCSSKVTPMQCSAVIGDKSSGYKVVYYSTGHMTETYSLFLTTVLNNALKPHM